MQHNIKSNDFDFDVNMLPPSPAFLSVAKSYFSYYENQTIIQK
jgi:hypothetical protein